MLCKTHVINIKVKNVSSKKTNTGDDSLGTFGLSMRIPSEPSSIKENNIPIKPPTNYAKMRTAASQRFALKFLKSSAKRTAIVILALK
jgi:hypothetical protein